MLRIAADMGTGERIVLRLDGQIAGRWVRLLQSTCEAPLKPGVELAVDLRNVSFADREGIDLLRGLLDRGIEIQNALTFLAEQIWKAMP